jgi:hypothetical protein
VWGFDSLRRCFNDGEVGLKAASGTKIDNITSVVNVLQGHQLLMKESRSNALAQPLR